MTQLVLPRRFTQQPQQAVQVDSVFGKPIGTVLLGSVQQAVNGGALTKAGAIPTISTPVGQAWEGNTAGSRIAYATARRPFVLGADSAVSFVVVFRKQNTAVDQNTIAGFGAASGASGDTLFRLVGGATASRIQFQVQDGAATVFYNTQSDGTTPIDDLNWHTAVIGMGLQSGDTLDYTIDGRPNGSVARSAGTPSATTFPYVAACGVLRGNAPLSYGNFDVALVAPIFGRLSTAEAREVSLNPWQLFKAPARRIWVSAAAPAGTTVDPAVGTVALTGYAPTVAQSENQSVTPAAGSLAITGYAPTIAQPQAVGPDVGALSITGYAPTVTQAVNQAVNPDPGTLAITGYAPAIAQSVNQSIAPDAGSVALTGYAPSVTQSAHQTVTPNAGALVITGYAPSIAQESASRIVLPAVGSLTITGYAPVVAQSGGQDGFGGVPFFHSEQATKYRRNKAEEESTVLTEVKPEQTEPVAKAVESAIVKVAKRIDLTETKAKATLALKAELKRQEIAYEKLYAKQLEEQRNALLIQELQDLIQQDLEEQDEEEAMLLLM